MKEAQIKQFYQMIKAGFESVAKSMGIVKVEIPKVDVVLDVKEVVSALGETNAILKQMAEKGDENYEITLKITE